MNENETYLQLANASYEDNLDEIKKILSQNKELDLNKVIYAESGKRGNGTPLILTASKEIAQLLINNGAIINYVYKITENNKITALDSALHELNKQKSENDIEKLNMVEEYIEFLNEKGAKKYIEVQ